MKTEEKIEHWLDIAVYDLETAKAMQASKRFLYTVFMCQQALEKLLKAIYIQQNDKEAPRTHNLSHLCGLLDLEVKSSYLETMARIDAYYIKGRYPSYKQKLSNMLDEKITETFLTKTEEIFTWLKSHLS